MEKCRKQEGWCVCLDSASGHRFFIALPVLEKWSKTKIGGELNGQNGYWGVEEIRLLKGMSSRQLIYHGKQMMILGISSHWLADPKLIQYIRTDCLFGSR